MRLERVTRVIKRATEDLLTYGWSGYFAFNGLGNAVKSFYEGSPDIGRLFEGVLGTAGIVIFSRLRDRNARNEVMKALDQNLQKTIQP